MEIWILIGILLASGFIGCTIIEIYENIQVNKWMCQRHLRELKLAMEHPEFFSRTYDVSADEIRKALDIYKTSKVTTHLPTGGVDVLGPGRIIFGEEVADEVIKEARERRVGDIG